MSEDGIDFAEYDSPEDVPIHPRSFGKIAEEIEQLITKYDFAFSRLQESVDECDNGLCRQIAAEVKWRRKRERYAQCYIRQHQSRNKPARCPGPQYHFEVISLTDRTHNPIKGRVGPDICVWFPWKFWLRNCPRVDWPLPLKDGEMERYEKETILAAIYDFSMKGGRRIADGLNLEHYDKLTGINLPGSRYNGLVKQIPAKHRYHLERWLKQFEKDLQFLAAKGVSGVQGGRAAPASAASKTGQGETPPDVTPVADQPDAGDAVPIEAASNAEPSGSKVPTVLEDEKTEHETSQGEWSLPMTGTDAARRLLGWDKARLRDIEPSLRKTGIEKIEGTYKIRIRLDTLSASDRKKLEKHT